MIAAANLHKRLAYSSADMLREEKRFSLSC